MTNWVNIQGLILSRWCDTIHYHAGCRTVNNSPIQGYAHPDSNKYSTFLWDTCNIIIRFCFCDTLQPLFRGHPQDPGKCAVGLRFVYNLKQRLQKKSPLTYLFDIICWIHASVVKYRYGSLNCKIDIIAISVHLQLSTLSVVSHVFSAKVSPR